MSADWMWLIPSNGRYDWTVNQLKTVTWYHHPLPVYKKGFANRDGGYSETDLIPFNFGGYTEPNEIFFIEDPTTGSALDYLARNGHGKDAFRIGFNEIFSPWSNPSSQNKDRTSTGIGFKINSVTNGIYNINIYVNTAISAPPAKPQNLLLSGNPGNNYNKLTWTSNIEPDLNLYEVWRYAPNEVGTWLWAVLSTTTNTYYVDDQYYYAPGAGGWNIHYKIRAKDTQNYYSAYSDEVANRAEQLYKNNDDNYKTAQVIKFNFSNYPNPFNPVTNIVFSLEKDAFVKLKVFDILGREVANLLNENKDKGYYSYAFNGNTLASGIYLAWLEINNELYTMKIILNK